MLNRLPAEPAAPLGLRRQIAAAALLPAFPSSQPPCTQGPRGQRQLVCVGYDTPRGTHLRVHARMRNGQNGQPRRINPGGGCFLQMHSDWSAPPLCSIPS